MRSFFQLPPCAKHVVILFSFVSRHLDFLAGLQARMPDRSCFAFSEIFEHARAHWLTLGLPLVIFCPHSFRGPLERVLTNGSDRLHADSGATPGPRPLYLCQNGEQ